MKVVETLFFFPKKHLAHYLSHMFLHAESPLLPLACTSRAEKSPSFSMLHEGDVFLAGDSCSMSNHVKPQLAVLVWVCQEASSTAAACLTSLSMLSCRANLQTAAFSIRSGFFWDFFFLRSSRVGGCMDSTWKSGGLGGGGCRKWYSLSLLATQSWIG